MKKFLVLSQGYKDPTPEIMAAWGKWFASLEGRMVDPGSPLGPGKEITHAGTKELPHGLESTSGYMMINAESLDDAMKVLQGCPIITSLRVYEAMSH